MHMEGKKKFKPDPDLKLMDQVREVLRYHHYAYRTEQTYYGAGAPPCDLLWWVMIPPVTKKAFLSRGFQPIRNCLGVWPVVLRKQRVK